MSQELMDNGGGIRVEGGQELRNMGFMPLSVLRYSAEGVPESIDIYGVTYKLVCDGPPPATAAVSTKVIPVAAPDVAAPVATTNHIGSGSGRRVYPYTKVELSYLVALVEEMVGETKQPLYRQDFAKIAVKLNAKFAGVKVNKGDELASGVQRGPIVTGATKRRVRRFAQDNWIIPERSVPAIQDYVTRSIRVEYNEICQRLVGRIDEMYGLPRSGESKKRKVDDVNEEESMVGAIGGISGNGTFGSMMESGHDNVPGLGGYPGNGQIQGYQNITPHQNVWVPGPPYIPGNFYWL